MKTKTTLRLSAAAIGTLLTTMSGVGLYSLETQGSRAMAVTAQSNTAIENVLLIEEASAEFKGQVQEWKNILIRGQDSASFDKYLAAFDTSGKKFDDLLSQLDSRVPAGQPLKGEVAALRTAHAGLMTKYHAALQFYDKSNPEAVRIVDRLVKGVDRETTHNLQAMSDREEAAIEAFVKDSAGVLQAELQKQRTLLVGLLVVGLLASIGLLVVMFRSLVKKLGSDPEDLIEIVQKIVQGDLSAHIPVSQGDTGSVRYMLSALAEHLRSVINQIRTSAGGLATSSSALAQSSQQVTRSSNQQSDSSGAMAASIEQLSVTLAGTVSNIEHTLTLSRETRRLAKDGGNQARQAVAEIGKVSVSVQDSAAAITELESHSSQISAVVKVIKEIADQTNLLALNAAIEAARAGEQGRGFAVVADEVRKLAERTSKSTDEIGVMTQGIAGGTRRAVDSMHTVAANMSQGVEIIGDMVRTIDLITQQSEGALAAVGEMDSALREQESAQNQISNEVVKVAGMSEAINTDIQEVEHEASALSGQASILVQTVALFRTA